MATIPAETVGYKKVVFCKKADYEEELNYRIKNGLGLGYGLGYGIVKLKTNTEGVKPRGYKCRTKSVTVLEIENYDPEMVYFSAYDMRTTYSPEQTITVENYDNDPKEECRPGIHFFTDRDEARWYDL